MQACYVAETFWSRQYLKCLPSSFWFCIRMVIQTDSALLISNKEWDLGLFFISVFWINIVLYFLCFNFQQNQFLFTQLANMPASWVVMFHRIGSLINRWQKKISLTWTFCQFQKDHGMTITENAMQNGICFFLAALAFWPSHW